MFLQKMRACFSPLLNQWGASWGIAILLAFFALLGVGAVVYADTDEVNLIVAKAGNGFGRVASTPAGIDCGNDCTELYPPDTLVTLTATADSSSTFTGWEGACTGVGAVCAVGVNALRAVTATFTLNQYQFTVAKAGSGSGKVISSPAGIDCGNDCNEFYLHGTLLTLTASADSSATFAGWSGACSGANPVCLVTVDAAKSVTAIFILNQYALTVTKAGNGSGSVQSTISGIDCGSACSALYPHGTVITLTATATVPGSTFTGWQGVCSGVTTTCVVTMEMAKAVTALFTLEQYGVGVTKTGNGSGTVVSSPSGLDCGATCSTLYNYGALVQLTASPAANSLFAGWSGACTGSETTCTVTVTAAQTVIATFVIKQYELIVTTQGSGSGTITSQPAGIDCGTLCSSRYDHGTLITLTATPDSSSLFTGWQGGCTGTAATCVINLDAAKTVTALFTLKQYALTVTKTGNGSGLIASTPPGINCGLLCNSLYAHGTVITLTATADSSSLFTGWQGSCTGSTATCVVNLDAAKTVTAHFTLKQYALTVTKTGTGTGLITTNPVGINCGTLCSSNYDHGTVITLTATAESSSLFDGWAGSCTGVAPTCVVSLDAAKTVTAHFTLKQYALAANNGGTGAGLISSIPAGIICPFTCTQALDHGTMVTLTATPAISSVFSGWQGACTGFNSRCVLTMTSAQSVTATFTLKQYALQVDRSGNGTGTVVNLPSGITCLLACLQSVAHGTPITLTATPADDSTFGGWQGACNSALPTCALTVTAATQVTATFALKQYAISTTLAGNGAGMIASSPAGLTCGLTCTLTVDHGTPVTLTATPENSSLFMGWQGACSGVDPVCTLLVASPQAVTATFVLKQYPLVVSQTGDGAGNLTSVPPGLACPFTCTLQLEHGTVVTVAATAAISSTLRQWDGACTNAAPFCVITMDRAQTLTATFDLNAYDLTVTKIGTGAGVITSLPAGINCGLTCTRQADYGSVITVTATPDRRSTFGGWQGGCTGTTFTCTVTLTTTQTLSATFTRKQYALTVTKNGSGAGWVTSIPAAIDCGLTCTALIDDGTAITLTPTAGIRSFFAGWAGACRGVGPCVVDIDSSKQLTATFTGEPVVSLSVAITTSPVVATAGQLLTYQYQITNTGDLSVTVQALSAQLGIPAFTQLADGTPLLPDRYLSPQTTATARHQIVVPRCDSASSLTNSLTITGTATNGVITTTQASLTTPINRGLLPPQPARANTIYIGCDIQLAASLRTAATAQNYTMVVIVGPAPAGLFLQGVQEVKPYTSDFALIQQTNVLLREGCANATVCHTVRRMIIQEGRALQIETIDEVIVLQQVFIPLIQK